MRLNDAVIRALKPAEKQVMYRDDTLPGFGVRVSTRGVKSFCLMHGTDRRLTTIGRYPIITLAEAREAARRLLAQKTLGTYQPRSIRFSEALDLFVATHCAEIKTGDEYERLLKRDVLPALKSKTLDKISSHDIQDVLDRLSPSMKYHCFSYLRAFFTWTIQRSYLDVSPLLRLKRPSKGKGRERILSDRELRAVWNAAGQLGIFGNIVQLLIATGQRRGEIAKLKPENTRAKDITLPDTKNGRTHCFPVGPLAYGLIPKTNREYIFHAPRSEKKPFRQFSKAKLELDRLCGFKNFTLHDLRRTFRTIHARIGTPPHIGERLVNHIAYQSEVERIYDRWNYWPELQKAVAAYERELNKILKPLKAAA